MKIVVQSILLVFLSVSSLTTLTAQSKEKPETESTVQSNFTDRQAIITTINNFYIGDHTGSIKHKKLSMHEKGAYRYVNRKGEYSESIFQVDSDDSDQNYKEELLSIEIFDKMALAKLRLDQFKYDKPEYKVMILHKANGEWKITSINWGFGITQ